MDTLDQIAMPKDNKVEIEKRKKEVAAKRRAKIMAKMSAMQKNFIKENAELFENTSTELFPRVGSDMDLWWDSIRHPREIYNVQVEVTTEIQNPGRVCSGRAFRDL